MAIQKIEQFLCKSKVREIAKLKLSPAEGTIVNEHVKMVNDKTKGYSVLYQITKNPVTSAVCNLQGLGTLVKEVPNVYVRIGEEIAASLFIPFKNVFFQYIFIGENGEISPHYDAGFENYITYKCNLCINGPRNDTIHIDKNQLVLNKGDLYCFEASLFKHWLPTSDEQRIHLSYGFILPAEELGWRKNHARLNLGRRIAQKYNMY